MPMAKAEPVPLQSERLGCCQHCDSLVQIDPDSQSTDHSLVANTPCSLAWPLQPAMQTDLCKTAHHQLAYIASLPVRLLQR